MAAFSSICLFIIILEMLQQSECSKQTVFQRKVGNYLENHIIDTKQARSELECGMYCVRDGSCASVNYKTSGIGNGRCELNSKTLQEISNADKMTKNLEFNHLYVVNKQYPSSQVKVSQKSSSSTQRRFNLSSCKELLKKHGSQINGSYILKGNETLEHYSVYCHMSEIPGCGTGGWTLVMKLDGVKAEFNYNSPHWTNKETYAVEDGLEGLTEKQTKLASYWNTPFNKICLGMKVGNVTKWTSFDYTAKSLYDVISGENFIGITVGRKKWKSLIDNSALQEGCYEEGFNMKKSNKYYSKIWHFHMRIGLAANNQASHCNNCDTSIGFGNSISGCDGQMRSTSCGNVAVCDHFNNRNIPAFGYILVQ